MPLLPRLTIAVLCVLAILITGARPEEALQLRYYAGVCQSSFVGSNLFTTSSFIMRRETDPEAGRILEHILLFDHSGSFRELEREYSVDGNALIPEDGNMLALLDSRLEGQAWDWSLISFSGSTTQGLQLHSDMQLGGAGFYRETLISGPDGATLVYIDEYANAVPEAAYTQLLKRLQALNPHSARI